jgi:hypothetical protein
MNTAPSSIAGNIRIRPFSEPVRGYAPGSPEAVRITEEIERVGNEARELPRAINGKRLKVQQLVDVVPPHDHAHVLRHDVPATPGQSAALSDTDFGRVRDPKALAAVLESVGVEHELVSVADARSRWPQIAVDTEVLWHPDAGVIDAEGAVSAMLDAAVRNRARILTAWPVHRVVTTGTGYRLESGDAAHTLDAERIVVAAGGWLPALLDQLPLPAGFRALVPPLQVSQEYAYHFPYRAAAAARAPAPAWPTFIHKSAEIQTYGLPGGRDAAFRGQKLAEYNGGRRIPSALDRDGVIDPANRVRMVEYVRRYLPGPCPSPTPKRPACSPTPPRRTSSSTASTASRWCLPAPDTAPSSRP